MLGVTLKRIPKKSSRQILAENLKAYIEAYPDQPRTALAKKCRVSTATLSRIINEEVDIGLNLLFEIARGLKIPPNELITDRETRGHSLGKFNEEDAAQAAIRITRNWSADEITFLIGVLQAIKIQAKDIVDTSFSGGVV